MPTSPLKWTLVYTVESALNDTFVKVSRVVFHEDQRQPYKELSDPRPWGDECLSKVKGWTSASLWGSDGSWLSRFPGSKWRRA